MGNLVRLLPGLACAGSMALCMWLMMRGGHDRGSGHARSHSDGHTHSSEVTELRHEVARLRAELQARNDETAEASPGSGRP